MIPPHTDLSERAVNPLRGIDLRLSPALVRKLETVVEKARDKFTVDLARRLRRMRDAMAALAEGRIEDGELLQVVFEESLQIKGVGGTVGYDVLSRLAKSLNDFVAGRETLGRTQIEIVKLHIDSIYVVIANRITGAGGIIEDQVLTGLEQAARKFG